MARRIAGPAAALALGALLATAPGAHARVGSTVANFDEGPMVASGQVAFLEPFSLQEDRLQGVTYRATADFRKACQIMLVVDQGTISSEIFAIPVVEDPGILKAERSLLDSFLAQSGIPTQFHEQIRQQMVAAMDRTVPPRPIAGLMVQTMVIPAEVPLLVLAVARDREALPLPKPHIPPQAEQ